MKNIYSPHKRGTICSFYLRTVMFNIKKKTIIISSLLHRNFDGWLHPVNFSDEAKFNPTLCLQKRQQNNQVLFTSSLKLY